jgi:hypothetical protein
MIPEADPPANIVPLAVPAPDLARAERARRNGARSRGPVTAIGKARSARNAIRHGLTARHGVVLDGEDAQAFGAMAERILADLAPSGELASFLAADLAAAIWRTGRARRLERQAFAGDTPDADKLDLALRYGGSASRELHRALRALERLTRRPLAPAGRVPDAPAPDGARADADEVPLRPARPSPPAPASPGLAWGAGGPPPPPPGCLLLRPVPYHWSAAWWRHQGDAFPGALPVAVAADGTVHKLEDGAWVVQPPYVPPGARPPRAPAPDPGLAATPARPAAPVVPERQPAASAAGTSTANAGQPISHATAQRRNEPSQDIDLQRFTPTAEMPGSADAWRRMWGLTPRPDAMPYVRPAGAEAVAAPAGDPPPADPPAHERDRPDEASRRGRRRRVRRQCRPARDRSAAGPPGMG